MLNREGILEAAAKRARNYLDHLYRNGGSETCAKIVCEINQALSTPADDSNRET